MKVSIDCYGLFVLGLTPSYQRVRYSASLNLDYPKTLNYLNSTTDCPIRVVYVLLEYLTTTL